jgi:hypothetical protein
MSAEANDALRVGILRQRFFGGGKREPVIGALQYGGELTVMSAQERQRLMERVATYEGPFQDPDHTSATFEFGTNERVLEVSFTVDGDADRLTVRAVPI